MFESSKLILLVFHKPLQNLKILAFLLLGFFFSCDDVKLCHAPNSPTILLRSKITHLAKLFWSLPECKICKTKRYSHMLDKSLCHTPNRLYLSDDG